MTIAMENMHAFNNHLPVKVRFGEGIAETLPEVIKEVESKKPFLMVDECIEKFNPAAAALINKVKAACDVTILKSQLANQPFKWLKMPFRHLKRLVAIQ